MSESDFVIDTTPRKVQFELPRLKRFESAVSGQVVTAVRTHGKALIIHFDEGLSMYSHNQLYGKWMVRKRGSLPNTNRSLIVDLRVIGIECEIWKFSI